MLSLESHNNATFCLFVLVPFPLVNTIPKSSSTTTEPFPNLISLSSTVCVVACVVLTLPTTVKLPLTVKLSFTVTSDVVFPIETAIPDSDVPRFRTPDEVFMLRFPPELVICEFVPS